MDCSAHPTWIEIDLQVFKNNVGLIRSFLQNTKFCFPVKANAYGHGLCPIGAAAELAGVDYLAVAHLAEGILLRRFGIKIPILVMGAIHEEQIEDLIAYDLEFTISSLYKATLVAKICENKNLQCKVHLEVDTGMHRTGVRTTTAASVFNYMKSLPCFKIQGVYSHLATGDQPNDPFALRQIDAFKQLMKSEPFQKDSFLKHIANSGGVMFYPDSHLDMVRPSLLCLGYKPDHCPKELALLSPCFSLKTKISYFKVVAEGQGISYGRAYVTPKQTRIVTIPIGYGDGLKRSLSSKASVLIRGKKYPIVGNICMDQCMVDIGEDQAHVGDEVVLIGKQGSEEISLMEMARLCETIPYEVLCFFWRKNCKNLQRMIDVFSSSLSKSRQNLVRHPYGYRNGCRRKNSI